MESDMRRDARQREPASQERNRSYFARFPARFVQKASFTRPGSHCHSPSAACCCSTHAASSSHFAMMAAGLAANLVLRTGIPFPFAA